MGPRGGNGGGRASEQDQGIETDLKPPGIPCFRASHRGTLLPLFSVLLTFPSHWPMLGLGNKGALKFLEDLLIVRPLEVS